MTHTLTVIQAAYRPRRRLSPGDNREGQGGYPADDQPEDAVVRCSCGWTGYEDELTGGECPEKGDAIRE